MRTQMDYEIRTVGLSNLEAMCERVSGTMCHKYHVVKVTANRVHVQYSNEDEYATPYPMIAVMPCFPCDDRDKEARAVVLTIMNVLHDNCDGEGWQSFQPLLDCPELYRSGPDSADWRTRDEILSGTPLAERLAKIQVSFEMALLGVWDQWRLTTPNAEYAAKHWAPEQAQRLTEAMRMTIQDCMARNAEPVLKPEDK